MCTQTLHPNPRLRRLSKPAAEHSRTRVAHERVAEAFSYNQYNAYSVLQVEPHDSDYARYTLCRRGL